MQKIRLRIAFISFLFFIIVFGFLLDEMGYSKECSNAYDREVCFPHWSDLDYNGFNSREECLISSSFVQVIIRNHHVVYGIWIDPYTGKFINDPKKIDIDHIIPLKWAWDHGASRWTTKEREIFANDPNNLLPVSAHANRSKSDKGPSKWLPENKSVDIIYIKLFLMVCNKYKLDGCDKENVKLW